MMNRDYTSFPTNSLPVAWSQMFASNSYFIPSAYLVTCKYNPIYLIFHFTTPKLLQYLLLNKVRLHIKSVQKYYNQIIQFDIRITILPALSSTL